MITGKSSLGISGSRLLMSALPSAGFDEPPVLQTSDSAEPEDLVVEIVPVLESVGEVLTSGVAANPLQTVYSQLPGLGEDGEPVLQRSWESIRHWAMSGCCLFLTSSQYLRPGSCAVTSLLLPELCRGLSHNRVTATVRGYTVFQRWGGLSFKVFAQTGRCRSQL